jgi:MoaA/NifB/PqqE/SkfB family radical SAM enzyme
MGTGCNFGCTYCDRDYLINENLTKLLQEDDIPKICGYINSRRPFNLLTFHGGEPLLHCSKIAKIIDTLDNSSDTYFIQTNGSLILNNKEFFKKYKSQIFVSISYDFCTQEQNRTMIDIGKTLEFLQSLNIKTQLQSVIQINSEFFDDNNLLDIITLYKKYNVHQIDLITLRHKRGKDKFKVFLDDFTELEIQQYFMKFISAMIKLQSFGVNIYIDGAVQALEENKKYFNKDSAYLNIVSPNGYVYSEFDFLDYEENYFAIDSWKDNIPEPKSDFVMNSGCIGCEQYDVCGLKFLVSTFGKETPKNCKLFYAFMRVVHSFGLYIGSTNLTKVILDEYQNAITRK